MARAKFEIWTDCGASCPRCREALVSPDWSEFVSEGLVLNLWSCTNCGDRFDTEAHPPVGAGPKMTDQDWALVFPPMLVA